MSDDSQSRSDESLSTGQLRVLDRFRPDATALPSWLKRPRRGLRFLALSLQKAQDDELPMLSASLAFITILSLVPLLAGLSYFSVGFFAERQDDLVSLLQQLLPYSAAEITSHLREFLDQAQTLQGFGFLAFLVTALTAFSMIEKTINDIWSVPRRRPLRSRLNSFVLLLCWGPILIGATYSGLYFLSTSPAFSVFSGTIVFQLVTKLVPFVVTLFGLTMLYWQVPYTRVQFQSALFGGTISAGLLEALRFGFNTYTERAWQISKVYGSFGLALFFMISIQISWAIVLLGAELAYCVQNAHHMSRPRRSPAATEGSWLGLAAMVTVAERLRERHPVVHQEDLAEALGLGTADLRRLLQPLIATNYLQESLGEGEGYLLACDPHEVRVIDLIEVYESAQWDVLRHLPEGPAKRLQSLRARFVAARHQSTEDKMLADLLPSRSRSEPPKTETPETSEKSPKRSRSKKKKTAKNNDDADSSSG